VVITGHAEATGAASQERLYADKIAFKDVRHTRAHLADNARDFMTRHNARPGREVAAEEMQVRPADARAADGNLYLSRIGVDEFRFTQSKRHVLLPVHRPMRLIHC
jgi:hypothetical protein